MIEEIIASQEVGSKEKVGSKENIIFIHGYGRKGRSVKDIESSYLDYNDNRGYPFLPNKAVLYKYPDILLRKNRIDGREKIIYYN